MNIKQEVFEIEKYIIEMRRYFHENAEESWKEYNTQRKICEELETDLEVGDLFDTIEYDYPEFHLSMGCYLCTIQSGSLVLKEYEAAKWLTKENLDSTDWLPADMTIIKELKAFDE